MRRVHYSEDKMPKRKLAKIEAMLFAAYLKVREVRREIEVQSRLDEERKKTRRAQLVLIKGGKTD